MSSSRLSNFYKHSSLYFHSSFSFAYELFSSRLRKFTLILNSMYNRLCTADNEHTIYVWFLCWVCFSLLHASTERRISIEILRASYCKRFDGWIKFLIFWFYFCPSSNRSSEWIEQFEEGSPEVLTLQRFPFFSVDSTRRLFPFSL